MTADGAPDQPHREPIVVASYRDRGEAEISLAHLRSEGIDAFILDEIEGGILLVDGEGGVRIVVHAEDAEVAAALLAPMDS